jgi:ubiquinone/menaquinone biosynthesis C-methylase UbiE
VFRLWEVPIHVSRLDLIRTLFDQSAERYERDIVPVLAPLTADFAAYAAPQPSDDALDIGTGTGIAARMLAPYVRRVIGVDISPASLRAARSVPTAVNVHYARADIDRLPFPAGGFSLVVASFGLNATDPAHSLRAIRRVIAPGGRLAIQEWGPADALNLALRDLLADYARDDPGERLAALREQVDTHPAPWSDQLQDVDDYREWLAALGLDVEHAEERAPVAIRLPTAETYLSFFLAWTSRFVEVRAMDEAARAAFYAAARAHATDAAQPDGSLIWQPVVFRVTARKIR